MQFRLLRTSIIGIPSSPKAFLRFADSVDWLSKAVHQMSQFKDCVSISCRFISDVTMRCGSAL